MIESTTERRYYIRAASPSRKGDWWLFSDSFFSRNKIVKEQSVAKFFTILSDAEGLRLKMIDEFPEISFKIVAYDFTVTRTLEPVCDDPLLNALE